MKTLLLGIFIAVTWVGLITLAIANTDPYSCDLECLEAKKIELKAELELVEHKINHLNKKPAPIEVETEASNYDFWGQDFWVSLDLGQDLYNGSYTSVGFSVPTGPLTLSLGYWWGSHDYSYSEESIYHNYYVTLGYSYTLID